jgi:hypothetical protein
MSSSMKKSEPNDRRATWPVPEMLARGTFATGTSAERRLVLRNKIILAVILCWFVIERVSRPHSTPAMRLITPFLAAALCTYYAYEKRKYFLSLDELTRQIEMEGMAWAYSLGVLAALWIAGIGYAVTLYRPVDTKMLTWAPFLLFAVLLATIKGVYRYVATRRY